MLALGILLLYLFLTNQQQVCIFHDILKLLKSFEALIQNGHSIVVVEHNLDIIKCADWIIDLGPDGGDQGGNIVFEGTPENLIKLKKSHTGFYLKEKMS